MSRLIGENIIQEKINFSRRGEDKMMHFAFKVNEKNRINSLENIVEMEPKEKQWKIKVL